MTGGRRTAWRARPVVAPAGPEVPSAAEQLPGVARCGDDIPIGRPVLRLCGEASSFPATKAGLVADSPNHGTAQDA